MIVDDPRVTSGQRSSETAGPMKEASCKRMCGRLSRRKSVGGWMYGWTGDSRDLLPI